MTADTELTLNADDTHLVVGALLATAINLVREPGQGEAFGGDPEVFLKLADKIATRFVQAATAIGQAHPHLREQSLRDCYDIASIMSGGISAYESHAGPCTFQPEGFEETGPANVADFVLGAFDRN